MTVQNTKQNFQYKVIEKSIKSLKNENNFIDVIGDKTYYNVLNSSIKYRGVLVPILIDPDNNILWGKERVVSSMENGLETIPTIVVGKGMSKEELLELEVELLHTGKNTTHLDSSQLYFAQQVFFRKKDIPYTKYISEIIGCTQRSIQLKVETGKLYDTLQNDVKKVFQRIDSNENIPLNILTGLVYLSKNSELDKFISDLLNIEREKEVTLEELKNLSKTYQSKVSLKNRNKQINEKMEEKKQDVENTVNKNSTIEELEGLTRSLDSKESSHVITNLKKVFQYQIKRHFNLDVNVTEERDVMVIQSELQVDFKEEIKLIKSIIKGEK